MSEPATPPMLELLARRPFSFYPAIRNIEHNEWLLRRATWSEVLVGNTKIDLELWVPRQYVGEVSSVDQPGLILGLLKELEYKAGTVWPYERRVLAMPSAGAGLPPAAAVEAAPRRSVGRRPSRSSPESRIGRLVAWAVGTAVVVVVLVVAIVRGGPLRSRVVFTAKDQVFLELTRNDDYHSIVRKLGPPGEDRWRSQIGELQYRLLWYPQRAYFVVLMGSDRNQANYIGALDGNWHVIHYVELVGGGNTGPLLRTLPRF